MEPKLRFKEFSGDWEEKKLSDIAKIKGGYAFDSKKFINEKSEFQVIKMGNVYQNELLLERNPSYIQKVTDNQLEYILKKNDIIITLTGTIGKKDYGYSYRIKDDSKKLLLNQRLALIKNNKNCNPVFLEYIIKNKRFLDQFFSSSTGGTGNQSNVSIKSIEKFKVNISCLPEQTKIADFLSIVDVKIQNQQDKITHLENIKKGFMQKIFSRNIRFKDTNGNEFPEWEEKKIGDIYSERSERTEVKMELLSVTINNGVIKRSEIEGKDNSSDDKSNYKVVYKGDMVYNSMRMWQGASGISEYDGIVSPAYTVLNSKIPINNIFFSYLFKISSLVYKFRRFSQGLTSDTWNLKYPQIRKIKIEVPCLEEQQKIADFLSSFDDKIDAEKEILDHLKELKKGLLQQMFV